MHTGGFKRQGRFMVPVTDRMKEELAEEDRRAKKQVEELTAKKETTLVRLASGFILRRAVN